MSQLRSSIRWLLATGWFLAAGVMPACTNSAVEEMTHGDPELVAAPDAGCIQPPSTYHDGDLPLYYYPVSESSSCGTLCDTYQPLSGSEGGVNYRLVSSASACCAMRLAFATTGALPTVARIPGGVHAEGGLDPMRPPVKPVKPWEYTDLLRKSIAGTPAYVLNPAVKMSDMSVRTNAQRVEVTAANAKAVKDMIINNAAAGKTVNWLIAGDAVYAGPEIKLDLQFWGTFHDQEAFFDTLQGHPTLIAAKKAQNGGEFVVRTGKIYMNGGSGRWPSDSGALTAAKNLINGRIPGLIEGIDNPPPPPPPPPPRP